MKDKTQVWLESNCSMDDYAEIKSSNKIFNYFINKDIKKVDKKFCNKYNNDEDKTIIQQKIANFLLKNGSKPSNVSNLHLYVDRELIDYYKPDSDILDDDENNNNSYTPVRLEDLLQDDDDDVCSLTSDIYLVLETSKNKDFIIKLQTTCYDHCEIDFEEIELEEII